MTVAMVLVGGAIGAPLRYLTDLLVQSRHDSVFPWGTFLVNVAGSLVLGVTMGVVGSVEAPAWLVPLVGIGVCGAFTTFSTFGYETFTLIRTERWTMAASYLVLSICGGLAATGLGYLAGRAMT